MAEQQSLVKTQRRSLNAMYRGQQITKAPDTEPPPEGIGVYADWIATGGTNRVVLGGGFATQPWIQILDLP